MGKRNKRSKQKHSALETDAPPAQSQPETTQATTQCSQRVGGISNPVQEWNNYLEVEELVEKIRIFQFGHTLQLPNRADHFTHFIDWLSNNGVDTDRISIAEFGREEFGLRAAREMKKDDLVLSVPRDLMMTTETAAQSTLGAIMKSDQILGAMPNVVMALHLLCEAFDLCSKWRPYLNILPSKYATPLYCSKKELEHLKCSQVLGDVLNQHRNIARQYAYFYKLFQGLDDETEIPLKTMCYDDYRWAVTTVMTRQNQIPSGDKTSTITALIPLWDMCNHSHGTITTGFNVETEVCECFSMHDCAAGEQIRIFYGPRSNAEFAVHNGFVYPGNAFDKVAIRLGLSRNDPLYSLRSEALSRLAMLPSRTFRVQAGESPVDCDLLAFLRIFTMTSDELEARLHGDNATKLTSMLKDVDRPVSVACELRAWQFLCMRLELLLKSYPTTERDDINLLSSNEITNNERLLVQLRLSEKQLLSGALKQIEKHIRDWEDSVAKREATSDDLSGVAVATIAEEDEDDAALRAI